MESDELKAAHKFSDAAEVMLEKECFSFKESYEKWKEWDDDDPDKIEILNLRKSIAKNEEVDEKDIDGRILAYEYLAKKYSYRNKVAVITAEMLIDQACDPNKTYLDFHPSIYHNHVEPEQ